MVDEQKNGGSPLDMAVSRRKLLTLAGMGTLGMVIAACAGAAPTATPTPTRAPAATPTPTPKPKPVKESLTVVFSLVSTITDPHLGPGKDRQWYRSVYEGSMQEDFYGFGIKPRLAKSVEFDADGNLVIKLREGVQFHGGETLTAEDIKWNVERIANKATGALDFSRFNDQRIKRVEVVDPLTAKLIVNDPPKPFLYNDLSLLWLLPHTWAQNRDKAFLAANANGTGPYKLTRYVPEQVAEVEAHDKWWGLSAGLKHGFKKISFRFNQEDAARLALLQRKEADIMYGLLPEFVEVAESAGLKVSSVNTQTPAFVGLHTDDAPENIIEGQPVNPLRDKRVRLAMNYAINRDIIVKGLLKGMAFPMRSHVPSPAMRGYVNPDELTQFNYNPTKAKELLKEAGYEKGFKSRMRMRGAGTIKGVEIAQAIIDQLKDVGIQVQLDALPIAIWPPTLFARKAGPIHLELSWSPAIDPWVNGHNSLVNFRWVDIPGMDQAYKDTFQFSIADQDAALRRFTKFYWEEVPNIWLWHPAAIWASQPDITWPAAGAYFGADFFTATPA